MGKGESTESATAEVGAIAYALDIGMKLVDKAEVYGAGRAEELLGHDLRNASLPALRGLKGVYDPSRTGIVEAGEDSLRRLGVDQIGPYRLDWRSGVPLDETVEGFSLVEGRLKLALGCTQL